MLKQQKKDNKVNKTIKYRNNLNYDSVYSFNKYSLPNFNKITSVDSKFDIINKFYEDFNKLKGVKVKKKIEIWNIKGEYDPIFKRKDKKLRLKHIYDNLKDLDYWPDQLQPDKLQLLKPIKVSKERFNDILSTVTEAKKIIKTSIAKTEYTLRCAESLLKGISSEKIDGCGFKKGMMWK